MLTIAVTNLKGGVGKSTISAALSVRAASTHDLVALGDLDPQKSLAAWWRVREKKENPTLLDGVDTPGDVAERLRLAGFNIAILDSAPAMVDDVEELMAVADFAFEVTYRWCSLYVPPRDDYTRSRVELERRTCRFGGSRVFFLCPQCRRSVLRLAVLPEGLRCGKCGSVTYGSRRQRGCARLQRRLSKLADILECAAWYEPPSDRPKNMRQATFERLCAERDALLRKLAPLMRL